MGDIVIVGAGLAGLSAAVTATGRGHAVVVLEESDGPGGRVRTDAVDGFLLDRGFQILLTAYPNAAKMLDFGDLDLRRFQSGALVQTDGDRVLIGDPLRRPGDLLDTLKAPVGSPIDKVRLLMWRQKVMGGTVEELWRRGEVASSARLADAGFSDGFVESFLRPLFAGITLDPTLDVSSRFTEFVFRMLAEGYGAVPAHGMGMIPDQLAGRLPNDAIRYNTAVRSVDANSVETEDGERIEADAVIVATDMDSAGDLVDTPDLDWNAVSTWWFCADAAPYDEPLLFLNGTGRGVVNNVAVLSNVSPHYAPVGRHLIAVSSPVVGPDTAAVVADLRRWFGVAVDSWDLLRTDEVSNAQPRYLPGEDLPAKSVLESGVFIAGDHRQNPSIDGAIQSGRRAAHTVFDRLA